MSPPVYFDKWVALKAQYNFTCPCCSRSEPEITLTRDHVIPLALGGAKGYKNLQPLCRECNHLKSGNHPTRYPIKRVGEVILLPMSSLFPVSRADKMKARRELYARLNAQLPHRKPTPRPSLAPQKKPKAHKKKINWKYWAGEAVEFKHGFYTQLSGQKMPDQELLNKLSTMGLILPTYYQPINNEERDNLMFPAVASSPSKAPTGLNVFEESANRIHDLLSVLEDKIKPVLVDATPEAANPPTATNSALRELEGIETRIARLVSRVGI